MLSVLTAEAADVNRAAAVAKEACVFILWVSVAVPRKSQGGFLGQVKGVGINSFRKLSTDLERRQKRIISQTSDVKIEVGRKEEEVLGR